MKANKPLEWTGHHLLSAKPPHAPCLPLRGSVRNLSIHMSSLQMAEKSPKYLEAIKMLPNDLVPIFDGLLEHYKFAALKCHGRAMASPLVIAELVLLGWRNAEDERQPNNIEELI